VIPAAGIGDGLLMLIASENLRQRGYQVTTFHPLLAQMQRWFPGHAFASLPARETFSTYFSSYDLVIAENDNGPNIQCLRSLAQLSLFYPTYEPHRHPPLSALDKRFNPQIPMAENISHAIAELLLLPTPSSHNGISPPNTLQHRLYPKRIIIHPTSSTSAKNWPKEKYLKLAKRLQKRGYEILFALSAKERPYWQEALLSGFDVPAFASLDELSCAVYESGYMIGNDSLVGHLASNLDIPTLILADNAKRMHLWRPGWHPGCVLTPASWIPNCKGARLKERYWQRWISLRGVLVHFDKLCRME
jgi:ADP-heptose:LPS heptosyltransferase